MVSQYRYDAFGSLFTGMLGPYSTTGLTGKTYDLRSGLMDYSARWYEPAAGRFTQPDPFGGAQSLPMSQHRYTYAYNNPVRNTDPTGMTVCSGGVCDDNIDTFYSTETFSYNVPWVTRTEPDVGGYWEYGWWADLRHWKIYMVYVDGHEELWRQGTEPIAYHGPYEYFVRTGPPPKSDDEIRAEDRERLRQEAGEAPPSAFYAPGVLTELNRALKTNWEGYEKGHSGPLNISYVEGQGYPTHPLVSNAKAMLKDLVGFPYVQDDEYGSFTSQAVREFQERMGLTKTPGIKPGVLDEATFYALKESHGRMQALKAIRAGTRASESGAESSTAGTGAGWGPPMKGKLTITAHWAWPDDYIGFYHKGIDFSTDANPPTIISVNNGKVVYADMDPRNEDSCDYEGTPLPCGYGNTVVVKSSTGEYVVYAHMADQPLVSAGDTVKQGTPLGIMGNTGFSLGDHLHLEVWTKQDESGVASGDKQAWYKAFPFSSTVKKPNTMPNNVDPIPYFDKSLKYK